MPRIVRLVSRLRPTRLGDGRHAAVAPSRRRRLGGRREAEDVGDVAEQHAVAIGARSRRVALAGDADDGHVHSRQPRRCVDAGRRADDDARRAAAVVDVEGQARAERRRTADDRAARRDQATLEALADRAGGRRRRLRLRRGAEARRRAGAERALGEAVVELAGDPQALAACKGALGDEHGDAAGGIGDEAASVVEPGTGERDRLDRDDAAVGRGTSLRDRERRRAAWRSASEAASAIGAASGSGVGSGGSGVIDGWALGVAAAGSGVGGEPRFCGSGARRSTKSTTLSPVSRPEPRAPPGSRSMLAPAAGATAGVPSIHALAAVPQPTASIAVVAPRMRTATLPPVAAMPDAYVASAIVA